MKKTLPLIIGLLLSAQAYAIKPVNVKVPVDKNGMTIEQKNIADKSIQDNKPGALKHLYVISAYSGDVLIYSTVRGKVTSSGKRNQPKTAAVGTDKFGSMSGGEVRKVNGKNVRTEELMQDDGTWGNSIPYLFWWDTKGISHKHYVAGGQILHITDQPMNVPKIIINMSLEK